MQLSEETEYKPKETQRIEKHDLQHPLAQHIICIHVIVDEDHMMEVYLVESKIKQNLGTIRRKTPGII